MSSCRKQVLLRLPELARVKDLYIPLLVKGASLSPVDGLPSVTWKDCRHQHWPAEPSEGPLSSVAKATLDAGNNREKQVSLEAAPFTPSPSMQPVYMPQFSSASSSSVSTD